MNTRQRYELRLLAESGSFDMEQVAADFDVSLRSIRYDVDNLNRALYGNLGTEPITVRQKTATVSGGVPKSVLVRLGSVGEGDFYRNPLTARERVLLTVFDLCWSEETTTIQEIADAYYVSRNTINRDMPQVRAYCEQAGVELVAQKGEGVRIVADEAARRRCLSKVLRDYGAETGAHHGISSVYAKWFPVAELDKIKSIVTEAEAEMSVYLDDIAFEAMVIHIALSVERYRAHPAADSTALVGAAVDHDSLQGRMATLIVRRIGEEFDIALPDEEVSYIGVHIGAKSSEAVAESSAPDASIEFATIGLIADVSRRVGQDLTHDSHLYQSLLQHLQACIYRRQTGLLLDNPLKDELLDEYVDLWDVVRAALAEGSLAGLIVQSDDELAYIVLHFAAALHRSSHHETSQANVVVVCATGFGTAELLASELNKRFYVNVVAKLPSHLVGKTGIRGVDLIVSTVPVESPIPSVVVPPILRDADVTRIRDVLARLGFASDSTLVLGGSLSETAREVLRYVRRNPAPDDEARLVEELVAYLTQRQQEEGERPNMLSELLDGGNVVLDVDCATWEESIQKAGQPLVDSGAITPAYIDAVIQNIKEVGPYVVITKGIALPHATNKVGVNRTAMSFARLATPVEFGSADNDPVEFLFMLATTDSTSHIDALRCLAELLSSDVDFRGFLRRATTGDEVVDFIRTFEQENGMS